MNQLEPNIISSYAQPEGLNSRSHVILCADDEEINIELLKDILVPNGYEVVSVDNGKDALQAIKSQGIDLVLLDINMPEMNGLEVCRMAKEEENLREIPVVMITGLASPEDRIRGIEAGADDYFTKPFHPQELLARTKILLRMKKLNDERKMAEYQREAALAALQKSHDELDYQVQLRTAELARANEILRADIETRKLVEEKIQHTLDKLKIAVGTTIQVMVSAVERRDPYTSGHQKRSADLARAIATEMGLPKDVIEGIRIASSIHDIGKLSIPAELLSKPTKLSGAEFSLIKDHARQGYEILTGVDSPWELAEIVYQHHERINGSGYPKGLKEDEIKIEAKILAVADVVESMASFRPYRPALGIHKALEEIAENRGILYDPSVADFCLRLFKEKGYHLPEA